jgi:hypothetical protein
MLPAVNNPFKLFELPSLTKDLTEIVDPAFTFAYTLILLPNLTNVRTLTELPTHADVDIRLVLFDTRMMPPTEQPEPSLASPRTLMVEPTSN